MIGERFVKEENFRIAANGSANCDTLTLATGECLRKAVEIGRQLEDFRRFADASFNFSLRRFGDAHTEGHVVVDRHVRIKRVGL